MKRITIEAKSKDQMLLSVMKKAEQAMIDYDLKNFDPNFAIKIFNKNDQSRTIILRVSRSAIYDNKDAYRYFLHLCVGINEGTSDERVSTYDIMDYYDDYVNRSIYSLANEVLPYNDRDEIEIDVLCNEKYMKTTWFEYTEDDHELDSVEVFVDTVVMGLVNILSDARPAVSIFFEYELRGGVKTKVTDVDGIFMNIQKSESAPNTYIVDGNIPSARFDNGRDVSSYPCCYKDLRSLLIQYLSQLFDLRKVLLFDEHMNVSYFMRSIEQSKIII